MLSEYKWVKSERPFQLALAADLVSGIGDWFNSVAVFSLLLQLTGSGMAIGITLALRTFPYLILGPYAGTVVDRVNQKKLLVVCNLSAACVALSFLLATSRTHVWIVYVATLGLVMSSAFVQPAKSAIVPKLVAPQYLVAANSLIQTVYGSVMAIGAFLGGVSTAAFAVRIAFVLNALSFVGAALLFACMRMPNAVARQQDEHPQVHPGSTGFRDVWSLFTKSRTLLMVTFMFLLWPVGGGLINVLLSVYAFQVFHAGNAGVGVMYGSLGVGFIIGGLLTSRFSRWLRAGTVIGFAVEGLGHAVMSQVPTISLAGICLTIATIGAGVGDTSIQTLMQQSVPRHMLGRVSALLSSASSVLLSFFMMIGGFLLNVMEPRQLGLVAGLTITVAVLVVGALLVLPDKRVQQADELSDLV